MTVRFLSGTPATKVEVQNYSKLHLVPQMEEPNPDIDLWHSEAKNDFGDGKPAELRCAARYFERPGEFLCNDPQTPLPRSPKFVKVTLMEMVTSILPFD